MKIEESLRKLEEITGRLERADLPLEEAIELFDEGLALASSIKDALDKARLRIDEVVERAKGSFDVEPFDLD